MATKLASHVTIYTGTHKVLTLKDGAERDVEIWIGLETKDKIKRLPVPK